MKRAVILLAAGALILGSALTAKAQAPTVSFGGQMRVFGFATDNITDFKDSQKDGTFRDSQSFYFQRWRLFTTVESADKKAKAYWALEVGDITWGRGGGAASDLYGCSGQLSGLPASSPVTGTAATTPPAAVTGTATNSVGGNTRVGNGSGGCLGNDGINVETKNLYLWFEVPGVPGANLLLGIHNILFLNSPIGAFMDDDGQGIQFNWKSEPVDLQLYTVKASEGNINNADDSDFYAARFGINVTPAMRLTLEALTVDQRSLAGQSFGDTFWVGGTASAKVGDINLFGSAVYGQRAVAAAAGASCGNATNPCQESGFGAFVSAQAPVGPVSLFGIFWYTTGDSIIGPATNGSSGGSSTPGPLTKDSDKLPIPLGGASWFGGGGPFIAEWLFGNSSIGAPSGPGQRQYADPTGTYGVGLSASYALTPALSIGGGAAYVIATDAPGVYGDNLLELDAGLTYRLNANLVITGFAGYLVPDTGDNAWGLAFRTQYSF